MSEAKRVFRAWRKFKVEWSVEFPKELERARIRTRSTRSEI